MRWDSKWGTLVQDDTLTVPNWMVDWDKSSFHETKIVKQPTAVLPPSTAIVRVLLSMDSFCSPLGRKKDSTNGLAIYACLFVEFSAVKDQELKDLKKAEYFPGRHLEFDPDRGHY